MSNELFRSLFMAAVLCLITAVTYVAWQTTKVVDALEALKPQVVYCVWKHDNHQTRVVKGSAMARELAVKFRRQSDEGDCR